MNASPWQRSDRYDPAAVALADRHYNRQKPGTPQFIPPGTYLALISTDKTAVWVTSWPRYLGMITFIDPRKVRSTNPGCCYRKAGFRRVGRTAKGLLTFQLIPQRMPDPAPMPSDQMALFGGAP